MSELSEPGRNEHLITGSSHYSVTWHCHNNSALLKPCLTFSVAVSHFERLIFQPSMVVSLSPSFKVYNYCLKVHTFSLVATSHFFFSLAPFFLFQSFLAQHQRSREGPFVSDFAPKAVVLQGRLIITEYTTSGKTISASLMSNMRETKITKKKRMTRNGLERWSFFLSQSLLALVPGIVAFYCCSTLKTLRGT